MLYQHRGEVDNLKGSKMAPSFHKIVFLISSLILFALPGHADPIVDKGDWELNEVNTAAGVLCVASNKDSSWFRSETYYLQISKLKNKANSPVELSLKVENNKRGNQGFKATIKGVGGNFVFTPLSSSGSSQTFLGLGTSLSKLTELLIANDEDLEFIGVGGSKEADFSFDGDGFKEVVTALEKRCNNSAKLVDQKFESFFFSALPKNINPLKISAAVSQQLRSFHFSAYDLFAQGKEAQAALKQLIAKYQPALTELEKVNQELNQINSVDLPKTRETLAKAQKQQIDLQAEIAKLTDLIPNLAKQVSVSQKAFDEASAILAPHQPEFNRITGNLGNAHGALSEAQDRYAFIESRLSTVASTLSNLDRESDQLENSLPSQRRELNDLRSNLREAEQRRSQYDVSRERDRRTERDSEHRSLQDERGRLNSSLSQINNDISNIQSERERIKKMLEQCRATTPAKDCSDIEKAMEVSAAQLNDKERSRSETSSRLTQILSRLSDIERSIDRTVQQEYDTLVNRETEIRQRHNQVEDRVRNDESRLSQIRSSDIPKLEREQSQLMSEKPQVSARIRDLNEDVARILQELENFKRATDWDRKAKDVAEKSQRLQADKKALSLAQSQKAKAEQDLENARQVEKQSNEKISALIARVGQLQKRAQELSLAVKPLETERLPLDRQIAELSDAASKARNSFLDLLK